MAEPGVKKGVPGVRQAIDATLIKVILIAFCACLLPALPGGGN